MCLIFSSSVETTHRLCRLVQIFNGQVSEGIPDNELVLHGRVAEISSLMRPEERANIIRDAQAGRIKVLISSDNMARGIDLPNVKLVINYDPPKFAKTYVHRVGRTARANRAGHSITLLKKGQVGAFRKMRASITGEVNKPGAAAGQGDRQKQTEIDKCIVLASNQAAVKPFYDFAIHHLADALSNETDAGSDTISL